MRMSSGYQMDKLQRPAKKASASIQDKFAITRKEMTLGLVEREEEIDVILTALICQENPLFVGSPGTGKSMLADSLLQWMGTGKKFSVLLNKFTTPEEIFGPISVQGLKQDQYRRITTDKLPEADVALLDEIFKASSAILNTMLRILNERVFANGTGSFVKCPLLQCVAASNEWPNDQDGGKELGALFDRFLFRKTVHPIRTIAGRNRLLMIPTINGPEFVRSHAPKFSTTITRQELEQANKEAFQLAFTQDAKEAFLKVISELNKEGIFPGDRRQYKSVNAVQSFAYLANAQQVEVEHLEILAHTLWDDPQEQPIKAAKIVARIANPVGMIVNELLLKVESIMSKLPRSCATKSDSEQTAGIVSQLDEVQVKLNTLKADPRRDNAVQFVLEQRKTATNCLIGVGTKG